MGGTILLVEDNLELNEINRRALELDNHIVLTAHTLAEAGARLENSRPDVILLDVMLPDGDGMEFCEEIRDKTDAHILFLTSKTQHEDHLRGLGAGGDDYIVKPYQMDVLLARVAAVLRRREMQKSRPQTGLVECGRLALNTAASRAYWKGDDLKLTQKEFALLLLLVQNRGTPLAKTYLYETVWNQPLIADGNALFTHMSRLKKRLEQASGGAATLFTSRGEGYSLILE